MVKVEYTDTDGINKTIMMTDLEYRSYLIWRKNKDHKEIVELLKGYFKDDNYWNQFKTE